MARFASALTQQSEESWVESRFAGADCEVVDIAVVVAVDVAVDVSVAAICGAQVLGDSV